MHVADVRFIGVVWLDCCQVAEMFVLITDQKFELAGF